MGKFSVCRNRCNSNKSNDRADDFDSAWKLMMNQRHVKHYKKWADKLKNRRNRRVAVIYRNKVKQLIRNHSNHAVNQKLKDRTPVTKDGKRVTTAKRS